VLIHFDPFREVDQIFQQVTSGLRAAGLPMDAYRRGEDLIAEFDLPGVARDSIDVTVEKDVLTITAERGPSYTDDDQVLAAERPTGKITRRLYIGDTFATDKVEATYDDGVLRIRLPLAEHAKPHKVVIGTGNGQAAVGAGDRQEEVAAGEPQEAVAAA